MASKRFYCTICKKVKRVRRLPSNVTNNKSMTPEKRVGSCDRHYQDSGRGLYPTNITNRGTHKVGA